MWQILNERISFFAGRAFRKSHVEIFIALVLGQQTGFRCIPFEGKQDLEKQLVRKIDAYQNSQARFIVLRHQDSAADCAAVKRKLMVLCEATGKAARCVVCIACKELEAFYLADLLAVEEAFGLTGLAKKSSK